MVSLLPPIRTQARIANCSRVRNSVDRGSQLTEGGAEVENEAPAEHLVGSQAMVKQPRRIGRHTPVIGGIAVAMVGFDSGEWKDWGGLAGREGEEEAEGKTKKLAAGGSEVRNGTTPAIQTHLQKYRHRYIDT